MATTTNFGWETPDDTDLVKDGAAAIRTLGGAIDTSLVDLKGGTTGQVLSKASNTDMDFTWVAQDDSNAIQNTIVDAKGDLISATAADTPARLAVGTNGQVLTADSTASTGLKWSTPASGGFFKNPVLNSNFSVWQRGTSFAVNATTYTADRWCGYRGVTGMTVSRQSVSDSTNLPNIQYCTRIQRDSGNTSTTSLQYGQMMETVNAIAFAGKTVTLSFYARKGANYSPSASNTEAYIVTGTGTDQNYFTTYTGSAFHNVSATLTTTWQRFSGTFTLSSTATEIAILMNSGTLVGTAGANDYYEVTGVQLEVGSSATDYYSNGNTQEAELAACQRYYEKSYDAATNPATATATGAIYTAGSTNTTGFLGGGITFKVTKRNAPTVTIYDAAGNSGKCSRNSFGVGSNDNQAVATFSIGNNNVGLQSSGTSNNAALIYHYVADSEL